MSDLYNQLYDSTWWWAPLIAFAIGAAGSLHCVGMCGGLSLAVAKSPKELFLYNAGRLLGYLSLSAGFFFFGSLVLGFEFQKQIAAWGGAFIGFFLLLMGVKALRGGELRLGAPFLDKLYSKCFRKCADNALIRPFGIGALSILLPCGLAHAFILGAFSTGGWQAGFSLVFFFWLGTMPAMTLGPAWVSKFFANAGARARAATGALFLLAGTLTLIVKLYQAFNPALCLT